MGSQGDRHRDMGLRDRQTQRRGSQGHTANSAGQSCRPSRAAGPSARGSQSHRAGEGVSSCERAHPGPARVCAPLPTPARADVTKLLSAPFHARSAAELDNRSVTPGCNFPVWEALGHNCSEQLAPGSVGMQASPWPPCPCRPRGGSRRGTQQRARGSPLSPHLRCTLDSTTIIPASGSSLGPTLRPGPALPLAGAGGRHAP